MRHLRGSDGSSVLVAVLLLFLGAGSSIAQPPGRNASASDDPVRMAADATRITGLRWRAGTTTWSPT